MSIKAVVEPGVGGLADMDNRVYAVLVIEEAVIGGGGVAPVGASNAGL